MITGKKWTFFCLIIIFISLPARNRKEISRVEKYPDILNIQNIPRQAADYKAFCFADLGAWFGFGLPKITDKDYLGSFTGPFLMSNVHWIGSSIVRIMIKDQNNNKVDFSTFKHRNICYYPGYLLQNFKNQKLAFTFKLFFLNSLTCVIETEIINSAEKTKDFYFHLAGKIFKPEGKISFKKRKLTVELPDKSYFVIFCAKNPFADVFIGPAKDNYRAKTGGSITVQSKGNKRVYLFVSHVRGKRDIIKQNTLIKNFLGNPRFYFKKTINRWQQNLSDILIKDSPYNTLAVKSLLTLINNWRNPVGDIKHAGLIPSYAIRYFYGFWAWDSFKHSVALVNFNPELARNQVRAMFDYQNKCGMIPDNIFKDKTENNWRNTKPPLAGWAVWKIYQKTNDLEFVREMFPGLVKYHRWWYQYRDYNKNGLCEYGSTDGTKTAATWESGMDNAVRFDHSKMLKSSEKAFSLNQESVDLNSYLFAEKIFLARMAGLLKQKQLKTDFLQQAKSLKKIIQQKMFDKASGFFYDISLDSQEFIKVQSPEGWIPLWAKVATQNQGERVKNIIMHPAKFNTYIPCPTLAADHEKLNTRGYWRGPVWLDQAYFAIQGLINYGFKKEARKLILKLFSNLEGVNQEGIPIRENYNPLTGKGLKANHFSWSAAHLLLLHQILHTLN